MTIPEVQQLKKDCEETIINLVTEFEKESGIIITEINFGSTIAQSAFGIKNVVAHWVKLKGEI